MTRPDLQALNITVSMTDGTFERLKRVADLFEAVPYDAVLMSQWRDSVQLQMDCAPDDPPVFVDGDEHAALYIPVRGMAERELLDGISKLFEVYQERKAAE